ncbi:serine/threonine kinase family protein [Plesiocystis pacifica SIR-1]|uniref:Serine/threonine kinase family protein n=1 Tax=Plesiocystis pacifica SIR-1 TaxID=391625 RepID=A6GCD2_9BACT|nr:serine/threonine-protein kinase [Plesiocystis pacifica]EDM76491.1 serine/threonine kinase family protein [Plesiocystis pacifica SIR-1]
MSEDSNPIGEAPTGGLPLALAKRRVLAKLLGEAPQAVRIGRFVLERELGRGGMGSVWLAHDEQLQRLVALKFLRSDLDPDRGDPRLLGEAQSLARLSHPNVIAVYDVGSHEGRVWIAMEYVPGQTMREWSAQDPEPRAVLRHWIAAGRGLESVHQRGLVHRDVKPDNVLLGEDGRVRLIDFGLVRSVDGREGQLPSTEPALRRASEEEASPTETGAFVGTFAYAAPEQRARQRVDALADQYAYCVSVWEALTGERPQAHPPVPPTGAARGLMSPRVRRALTRGLDPEPTRRYPSMGPLLAQLESRRGLWLGAAALGLTLAAGLVAGTTLTSQAPTPVPCSRTDAALERTLSAERRAALLAGLEPGAAAVMAPLLDDWSGRWRGAAQRSCEEVHVEQTRSPETLDRRRACLDNSLVELEVVLIALEGGEPLRADPFRHIQDPQTCLSPSLLEARAQPTLDPETAEQAAQLRARLVDLRIGAKPVSFEARIAAAEDTLASIEALDVPALRAYALETLTALTTTAGKAEDAHRYAGALIDLAAELDDPALLAAAWRRKADIELELELDVDAAQWSAQRSMELAAKLRGQPRVYARALVARGRVAFLKEDHQAAARDFQAASEELARSGPSNDGLRARVLRNLALALVALDDRPGADAARRSALELERRTPLEVGVQAQGDKHYGDAQDAMDAGKHEEATHAAQLALDAYAAEFGPDCRGIADTHILLANVEIIQGRFESSRTHAEAADRVLRQRFGVLDRDRFITQTALASAAFYERDFAAAATAFGLALELAQHQHQSDEDLALLQANLGEALLHDGRVLEARAMLERAVAQLEGTGTPERAALDVPRKALGATYLALGQLDAAQRELARARANLERHGNNPLELADATWLLARAELGLERRPQAQNLAESASAQFGALDLPGKENEIQAWLARYF